MVNILRHYENVNINWPLSIIMTAAEPSLAQDSLVQEGHDSHRLHLLGHRREANNVHEENRDLMVSHGAHMGFKH